MSTASAPEPEPTAEGERQECPICHNRSLKRHCANGQCGWLKCANAACEALLDPSNRNGTCIDPESRIDTRSKTRLRLRLYLSDGQWLDRDAA